MRDEKDNTDLLFGAHDSVRSRTRAGSVEDLTARINDCPIGIGLTNVAVDDYFNVDENHIYFNTDEYHMLDVNIGIYLTNCQGAFVTDNEVTWTNPPGTAEGINAFAGSVMGINAVKVQSSEIKDNIVTTCGTGMYMYDDCSYTFITCNHFVDDYPGIDFYSATVETLPDQGDTDEPTFNTWEGAYDNGADLYRVIISGGTPTQGFDYHYSDGVSDEDPDPTSAVALYINPVPETNGTNDCSAGHMMMAENMNNGDEEIASIIDEPSSSEFAQEIQYKKFEYAYRTMQELPELINTQDREDFMDSTEENNIGKLKEVQDLMLTGEFSQAQSQNNSITDTNLIEQNKKIINAILLSVLSGNDSISATDSTIIDQIAHEDPITNGEAVYWAMGKLKKDIIHRPSLSLRKANQNTPAQIPLAKVISVYPNPARDELFVNGLPSECKIEIYDGYGKRVYENSNNKKDNQISISAFATGIYFLKINNTSCRYRKTFSVIK